MVFETRGKAIKEIEKVLGDWVFLAETKIQMSIRKYKTKRYGEKNYAVPFIYLPRRLFLERNWQKGDRIEIAVHKKNYYLLIKNISLQEKLKELGVTI